MDLTTFNQQYMTPFHQVVYVMILVVGSVFWSLYQWSIKCKTKVKVIVVKSTGDTDTEYSPKEGNIVSLTKPGSKTTQTWPINKLATINTDYPGDGLVPKFLQKKIVTVIVDEDDWEPLLNRNAYGKRVASPDVVTMINALAEQIALEAENEKDEASKNAKLEKSNAMKAYACSLSTAPTREMIASPAMFGNIILEKISEALLTVNKETLDRLEGIVKRMDKVVTDTKLYICVALIIAAVGGAGYLVYQQQSNIEKMTRKIQLIENALGIVEVTYNGTENVTGGK